MKLNNVFVDANGYEREGHSYVHRLVAEGVLGRKLKGDECVHHVNGIKADNANKNLVICPDASYHQLLHARQRVVDLGGNPNKEKYCSYHKCLHDRSLFSSDDTYDLLSHRCREGTNEYRRASGISKTKWTWKRSMDQQYRRSIKKGEACEV